MRNLRWNVHDIARPERMTLSAIDSCADVFTGHQKAMSIRAAEGTGRAA